MALRRVERGRCYFKSGLVTTAQSLDLNTNSGDELGDGTDGSNYHTVGNEKNDCTLELIVPVDATGENVKFEEAIASHEEFDLTFELGGVFFEMEGFAQSIGYKSQSANGTLTASVKVMAGKKKQLGT